MKFVYLILISSILVFSSCDNPFASTPGTQGNNIVTGIYMTGEEGSTYSVWGNPIVPEKIEFEPEVIDNPDEDNGHNEADVNSPSFFEMFPPYPNPADGNMSIGVTFPRRFDVKVWMETASLSINQSKQSNGLYRTDGIQKFVLFDEIISQAGHYTFNMSRNTKCFGGELNQGFFRVFVQIDGKHTLWQDIYIGGVREKAPPGLRKASSTFPCSDYPDQINK